MTKLAEFKEENGQLKLVKLLINPKDFDITKKSYFNGDEFHTELEYEMIFTEIAEWCNNQKEKYTIDDRYGNYTVRTLKQTEQLNYKDMSSEEKEKYDTNKHNEPILQQISDLKKEMADNDYKQMKYIRGEYTTEEWEEIKKWFQEKAKQISDLEKQLI